MINWYKVAKIKCEDYTLVKLVNPRVTLIDFSVSSKFDRDKNLDERTCRGSFGTKRYRTPEMIWGGLWNASVDTFALALIVLECIQLTPLLQNKYRAQDGGEFEALKDDQGMPVQDPKETVDFIMRMAKTCLGKPFQDYVDSVTEEDSCYLKDAANIPEVTQDGENHAIKLMKHIRMVISSSSPSSSSSPQSLNRPFAVDKIDNPYYTPLHHAYPFHFGPTLSDVHQSHLHVLSKDYIIRSYFKVYKPFIALKMLYDKDVLRLKQMQQAIGQILQWDPTQRATPQALLRLFFSHEKDYLFSCLTQQDVSDSDLPQKRKRKRGKGQGQGQGK
ncbi:hypothetical protein RFI_07447 [Reticulomyxa filosa]|uniref:Protein kinase domain-containing protein n=1 Tax=Reticulomyxa filosa TaxID=46433 RepID=X6NUU6_RETFI|nr:hypothetical protein RFI_07447 [Reticulomyxa filosa]|eukprot:ETO29673.1 hypothetical protein RFI_07447 [Reticulomyxa filosa]